LRWASSAARPVSAATRVRRPLRLASAARQIGSTMAASGDGAIRLIVPSISVITPTRSPARCAPTRRAAIASAVTPSLSFIA